jgi:sulfur-carrier protein
VAEDPRRITTGYLHKECSCRGYFGRSRTTVKQDFLGCNFIRKFKARQTTRDKEVATDKKVIVPVTVYIPGPLREFSEGQSKVEIEESPATLAGALSALWILFPGLRDRIVTEQGEIREHINIFIGDEDVRFTGGLTTRIPAGAELSIVPSITGG